MIKATEARANVSLWDKQKVANQLAELDILIKNASCLGKKQVAYKAINHPKLYQETIDVLTKMGYIYDSGLRAGIKLNEETISW